MNKGVPFSIKTKFVLITALIVAFFAVTVGGGVISEEREHLAENLEEDGRVLVTSLKAPIINTMILDEMGIAPGLLDNYVDEIVGNRELTTEYAFITDEEGKVLAHSRSEENGKVYRDPLTRAALTGDRYLSSRSGHVLDLALPLRIYGKSWGALRVGISTVPMEESYLRFKMRTGAFVALSFVFGTAIFYILGVNLSRPLQRLSRSMERVELGDFQATPLPPRSDEIGQLQESFQDMLRRLGKSEQERRKTLNHLIQNEKMISIGRIVAGVAHEINNPLAAMSACAYKLEGKVLPAAQTSLEILKETIPRMETIVRQLSDFSRAGTLELREVESDVFFSEVQAFAAMTLKDHRVRLTATDGCSPPVTLRIDKGKLHQVVLNLLLNAAAASSAGDGIELGTGTSGPWYLIEVRDHGRGIPEADREHIFDIFFTTKPAGEGSGIGLAVCKSIVDLHLGEIKVESNPGETTFRVRVPLPAGGIDG